MEKLQLYITISLDGFRNMAEINEHPDIRRHVVELSDAVRLIDYNPQEKNIFYLLRSTDEGVFIVLLRTIPTNPVDHLAAWIFVPYAAYISDEELLATVALVRDTISNPKISSDDMAKLKRAFDKGYEELSAAAATVACHGDEYAHRFYRGSSGYELTDYLGNKRYQTTYLRYAGVLLVDATIVKNVEGPDLTNEPLEQMVRIFPPKLDERPYKPTIFNQPFDKPYLVPLMSSVEIVWVCPDAPPIRQSVMISKPNMRPDNIASTSIRQTLQPKTPAAKIEPAAKPLPKTEEKGAEETVPVAPKVSAHADAHSAYDDRTRIYNFEIPAKSADISGMIHFEIKSRNGLYESPIDGYDLCGEIQEGASRSNHLIYMAPSSKLKNLMWGLIGMVIGMGIAILAMYIFQGQGLKFASAPDEAITSLMPDTTVIDTQTTDALPDSVPATAADISLEAAIKYLDTNDTWDKATLEQYPDLKGLYDDLNTINRERINGYWKDKLNESRKFAKIVEHNRLGGHKKPRLKDGRGTFNPPGQESIYIRTYLNTIDP